jgi:hypothetical protein
LVSIDEKFSSELILISEQSMFLAESRGTLYLEYALSSAPSAPLSIKWRHISDELDIQKCLPSGAGMVSNMGTMDEPPPLSSDWLVSVGIAAQLEADMMRVTVRLHGF